MLNWVSCEELGSDDFHWRAATIGANNYQRIEVTLIKREDGWHAGAQYFLNESFTKHFQLTKVTIEEACTEAEEELLKYLANEATYWRVLFEEVDEERRKNHVENEYRF